MSAPTWIRRTVLILVVLLPPVFAGAGNGGKQEDVTSSKIWVYFADHGERSSLDLAAAVEAAPVSGRSLERRRNRGRDARALTDVHDLPVNAGYIERVRAAGCVVKSASKYLNAVSVLATPDQITAIRQLRFVEKVTPVRRYLRKAFDARVELPESGPRSKRQGPSGAAALDYGASYNQLDQINVIPLHDAGVNGEGVWIGVFDTGFNLSHVAFDSLHVHAQWDFIFHDGNTRNEPGQDVYNQDHHGTMVLSTIGGYAPGNLIGPAYAATFVLAKTERQFEEVQGEEDDFVRALEWVDSIGVDIVSSSLGYYNWYTFADMDGNTAVTTIACDIAASKGITICMAAGNERNSSWGHIIAPSDGDSVIACGAVDQSGNVANFSSPGPSYDGRIKPDVSARGVSTACVSPWDSLTYTSTSGTSLSTPLIGGACGLILQMHPHWGPMDVLAALRDEASHSTSPNNDVGWGIIDTYRSALGGATAVVDAISLEIALSGSVVVGSIFNGNPAERTVDIARQKRLPGSLGWETTEIVPPVIVVPGSSSATFSDTLDSGGVYRYRLRLSDEPLLMGWSNTIRFGYVASLGQRFPNPFVAGNVAEATIPYAIGGAPPPPGAEAPISAYSDVLLEVYDVRGARVTTLFDGIQGPGNYSTPWDGRDLKGNPVASGVYFYRLRASGHQFTKKIVLIRR
jgi:hypothetical protein